MSGGIFARFVQPLSLVYILGDAALCWSLFGVSNPSYTLLLGTVFFIAAQSAIAVSLLLRPVRRPPVQPRQEVIEHSAVNLSRALFLRAGRTARYRSANLLLITVLTVGGLVAWFREDVLPFDALAVILVSLVGTLGQEARGLSRRTHPIELLQYSLFGRWLRGIWTLALGNGVVVITALLLCAALCFQGALSVTYFHVACVGIGLLAAGVLAGSLVVPNKGDLLAQLASAIVYAVLVWLLLRLLGTEMEVWQLTLTTLGVAALCLGMSWLAEHIRWLITIRGKHGLVLRTRS
jgi:hypothetical protein